MRLFRRIFFYGIVCMFLVSICFYCYYYCGHCLIPLSFLPKDESHSYGATNEIINPFAYSVLISPKLEICFSNDSNKNILFIIHSKIDNIFQRSFYRTTFGKNWLKNVFGFDIFFVVGKHSSPNFQNLVEQESKTYKDILQGDFFDTYQNLTIKAIIWLKFIAENCAKKNLIIVKSDDDVLIDLEKMKNILLQYAEQLQTKYFCFSHKYMVVERGTNSPWYVPFSEMEAKHHFYDEYCSGFAYVTSTAVLNKQWKYLSTHNIHYHRIDDFFITGKLAAEANIGHINEPSFFVMYAKNLTAALNGNGTFFLMHEKNARQILWIKMLKKWINNLAKL